MSRTSPHIGPTVFLQSELGACRYYNCLLDTYQTHRPAHTIPFFLWLHYLKTACRSQRNVVLPGTVVSGDRLYDLLRDWYIIIVGRVFSNVGMEWSRKQAAAEFSNGRSVLLYAVNTDARFVPDNFRLNSFST